MRSRILPLLLTSTALTKYVPGMVKSPPLEIISYVAPATIVEGIFTQHEIDNCCATSNTVLIPFGAADSIKQ